MARLETGTRTFTLAGARCSVISAGLDPGENFEEVAKHCRIHELLGRNEETIAGALWKRSKYFRLR